MYDSYKKTALDDDASIYNADRERTEKQKWREMSKEQRRQYFADYYLRRILCILAGAAVGFFLIWHFMKTADETVLYVAVVDESLDTKKLERMSEELNDRFKVDGRHKKVIIDDTFFMKDDALTRMEVYLHNNQLDVIIADENVWRELSGYGFLKRLDEFLGNPEKLKESHYENKFLEANGYLDGDDISFEDEEVARGEMAPYGVDISESRKFGEMKEYMEHPVFAIAEGAKNEGHAEDFLDYLME